MWVTTPYKIGDSGLSNYNLQHRLLRDGQGMLAILYQRGENALSSGFSGNGGMDWTEPEDILSEIATPVAALPALDGFYGVCACGNPPEFRFYYGKGGKWNSNVIDNNSDENNLFFAPDLALFGAKGVFAVCADVDSKTGGWRVSCRESEDGGRWNKKGKMPWAGRDKGTISPGEKNAWRLYAHCLCTDGEGQIHLAYRDLRDGYLQIFYSKYLPVKAAWSTVKQITATPCHKGAPSIMWDEQGIVLAWTANYSGINVVEYCPSFRDKNILRPGPCTGQFPPLLRIVGDKIWVFWLWEGRILCCPRDEANKTICLLELPSKKTGVEFDVAWEPEGEKILISVADTGSDGIINFTAVSLAEVLQSGSLTSNYFIEDDVFMKIDTTAECCGLQDGDCTLGKPVAAMGRGDLPGHLSESRAQVVDESVWDDAGALEEEMCCSSIWLPAKLNREEAADEERESRELMEAEELPPASAEIVEASVSEPEQQEEFPEAIGDRSGGQDPVEVRVLPPVAIAAPYRYDIISEATNVYFNRNTHETPYQSPDEVTGDTLNETLDGSGAETADTPEAVDMDMAPSGIMKLIIKYGNLLK